MKHQKLFLSMLLAGTTLSTATYAENYDGQLDENKFSTSANVTWKKVGEDQKNEADVVAIKLPNEQTEYFKYTYIESALRDVKYTQQKNLSGNVNADFIDAEALPTAQSEYYGGAIYNETSIDSITGDFIRNNASSSTGWMPYKGGAIYSKGTIGDIAGDFIANSVGASSSYSEADGGAIYNDSTMGKITGNFIGNHAVANSATYGGGIYNNGILGDIKGNFYGNYSQGIYASFGGAIYNKNTLNNITGDFIGNYLTSTETYAYIQGGAIFNEKTIGNLNGSFIGNYASSTSNDSEAHGGAIYNKSQSMDASIGDISGDFIGNYVTAAKTAHGGAIYNSYNSNIGNINADFIENYTSVLGMVMWGETSAYGGAIYNADAVIGNITGNFTGNYITASGDLSIAFGGAIYNTRTIGNISGNFTGNYAEVTSGQNLALGGAVYTTKDLTFVSGNQAKIVSGNYTQDNLRGKIYNAIAVHNQSSSTKPVITFDTTGGGSWTINDNIEGGKTSSSAVDYTYKYDLSFIGDDTADADLGTTTQFVAMNNAIINADEVNVENITLKFGSYSHGNDEVKGKFVASLNADGTENSDALAVTKLFLNNAVFDVANGYTDEIKLKGFNSSNGFYHVDVNTTDLKADELHINGDVAGTTNVIVHASSDADIRGEKILFAKSTNDTQGNENSFKVTRVYKSPYLYDVVFNPVDDTQGNNEGSIQGENSWYLSMNNTSNSDLLSVTSEVIGALALPRVALTQKTGMIQNIMHKVKTSNTYPVRCQYCSRSWFNSPHSDLWVNTDYNSLNIKSPVDIDAKVFGIEAGGDIQTNFDNKLGIFASYRKGSYEMDGQGEKYVTDKSSEIDAQSYLIGLYHQYDDSYVNIFSAVYAGMQKAELSTDDGFKTDNDGFEFGANVEAGVTYDLINSAYLIPSVGAAYTQVSYDDTTDSLGKKYQYEDIKQLELEFGVKLGQARYIPNGFYNIYVKPSIIQTLNAGNEVKITNLDTVEAVDNMTLGSIELGGTYDFGNHYSTYGWLTNTFGSDYTASSIGLGFNYNW